MNKKSDGFVPLDADDWQLFNASVPAVLKKYADEGHKIAIFSNQVRCRRMTQRGDPIPTTGR